MITIEVSGMEEILRRLKHVQQSIQETIPKGLERISRVVEDSTYQNFIQAGRPTWPEREGVYDHPPLMDTLAMMEGAIATSRYWFHEGRNHHIDIESTEYAIYQQEGTYGSTQFAGSKKTKTLPARPFANTTEDEENQIEEILYDAIEELF
jgi:phage gpG-like protein